MFRALSMNKIYSNGLKLYPFSGHSGSLGDNSYEGALNGDVVWV